MRDIRESDLPGIGKKYKIETNAGDKLVIIIHDDGLREVYHYPEDDPDESISVATLSDEESRQLAAVIGGMTYQPKALESIEIALDDLVLEWVNIESGFKSVGKTIVELQVRQQTGANIVAILDKHKKRISSDPEDKIQADTIMIIVGDRSQIKLIKNLLLNGEIKV